MKSYRTSLCVCWDGGEEEESDASQTWKGHSRQEHRATDNDRYYTNNRYHMSNDLNRPRVSPI